MKPRNFPTRVRRRQARAYKAKFGEYPKGYIELPTDIKLRLGADKRKRP